MPPAHTVQPRTFLDALGQRARAGLAPEDLVRWAQAEAVAAHLLSTQGHQAESLPPLHAAGARAIAASLAIGAEPLVLLAIGTGPMGSARFVAQLVEGLQGYERIHALVQPLVQGAAPVLIAPEGVLQAGADGAAQVTATLFWALLILPPEKPNSYWSKTA